MERQHVHVVHTDPEGMVPEEAGFVHPSHVRFGWAFLFILWAAAIGLIIWGAVVMSYEAPYYAPNAITTEAGDYVIYQNRAAEPFNGKPFSVVTNATTADVCIAHCTTTDTQCRFFTYDQTNNQCNVYHAGILPGQHAYAATPGPTSILADVYVKRNELVSQLRGVLRGSDSNMFTE